MPELNTGSDFKWLDDLVAKMSNQDLHDDFWDCECDENYIHRKSDSPYCYKCQRSHGEQPDSRVSEVVTMLTTELRNCASFTGVFA